MMIDKLISYELVSGKSPTSLNNTLQSYLAQGYEPYGYPFHIIEEGNVMPITYCQAVVRALEIKSSRKIGFGVY